MSMPDNEDEIYAATEFDERGPVLVCACAHEFNGSTKYTSEAKKQEEIEQAKEKTRQQCADEIAYLEAKIKSAMCCHPNVVQVLLDEAINRTHFNAGKQDKGEG